MSDKKSKMPDLKELGSMASKLFGDIKESVSEIIKDYKEKHPPEAKPDDTKAEASPKEAKPEDTKDDTKPKEEVAKPTAEEAKPEEKETNQEEVPAESSDIKAEDTPQENEKKSD